MNPIQAAAMKRAGMVQHAGAPGAMAGGMMGGPHGAPGGAGGGDQDIMALLAMLLQGGGGAMPPPDALKAMMAEEQGEGGTGVAQPGEGDAQLAPHVAKPPTPFKSSKSPIAHAAGRRALHAGPKGGGFKKG